MSAEIVNLRRVRKARARAEKRAAAQANGLRFGRAKHERKRGEAERELAERSHAHHKRDRSDEAP